MELKEIYSKKNQISFEIFPPVDGDISDLFEELRILKKYNPCLICINSAESNGIKFDYQELKSVRDLEFDLMPDFSCYYSFKSSISDEIRTVENIGVENVFVHYGNILENSDNLDFKTEPELINYIKSYTTLSVGTILYPEFETEETIKQKHDAGTDVFYTDLFFDNEKFYKLLEKTEKAQVLNPVIPRIIPLTGEILLNTIPKYICVPEKLKQNRADFEKIGVEFCINQCQDLIDNGIKNFQFLTYNNSKYVSEVIENIRGDLWTI